MLCHLDPFGREICLPLTPSPQIYYDSKEKCIDKAMQKVDDIKTAAIYENLQITELYFNCIEDDSKTNT